MIKLKDTTPIAKKAKATESEPKKAAPKIPFHAQDSAEVDFIRQKIEQNKQYLSKCTSAGLYKKVEQDTLFLENHILPVLLSKTSLFFNDIAKKVVKSVDDAFQNQCNAIVVYAPINENYTDNPKAGIANYSNPQELPVKVRADLYLYNLDGNSAPFEYVELI